VSCVELLEMNARSWWFLYDPALQGSRHSTTSLHGFLIAPIY
jgi:hypothetical protein